MSSTSWYGLHRYALSCKLLQGRSDQKDARKCIEHPPAPTDAYDALQSSVQHGFCEQHPNAATTCRFRYRPGLGRDRQPPPFTFPLRSSKPRQRNRRPVHQPKRVRNRRVSRDRRSKAHFFSSLEPPEPSQIGVDYSREHYGISINRAPRRLRPRGEGSN